MLGTATWPGTERPIAQPLVGALSHSLIAGPTGVGKSTLLTNLIASDIAAGRGVVLIDGKGDTVSAVLARIPEDRVLTMSSSSTAPRPGRSLASSCSAAPTPSSRPTSCSACWPTCSATPGGRSASAICGLACVAVAHDPDGTLADVPYVYSDAAYRRKLVARLHDPLARATFAAFEEMSAGERQQQLAASFNKLGTLLGRPIVRTVLGQPQAEARLPRVLRSQQIVLVSLSPTRVGAPAARLIGAVTVFALFQAVQGRIALPEERRRPFLVYIDEPKALGDLPMPLDALLEQARGLGVGVTLAPQSISAADQVGPRSGADERGDARRLPPGRRRCPAAGP